MKEMLANLANGQIEFYKAVGVLSLPMTTICSSISRPWKNGRESYPSFNGYAWTFEYVYMLFLALVYYQITYQLFIFSINPRT